MPEAPEKLDLKSLDLSEEKRQELLCLFPEIRTEGGKIDFDRLKLVLGETVDVGKERYGMHWPGKADCFRTIQTPSMGTLRPCPEESVAFDTTENLIIEGDNLEVLKLLQKSYLGRIKMIYIDPPYNTGNDFIYPDNFSESLQTYLEYTGQVDAHGRKFGTNTDTDGRFHSKWMNMMFPRLYLARNLLREDGVLFVTIDDDEAPNLRILLDQLFGVENFVACICWQKKQSPQRDATYFSDMHDYVLVYAKKAKTGKADESGWEINLLQRDAKQESRYKNPDNDPRGPWASVDCTINKTADERPNLFYEIRNPVTGEGVFPSHQRTWAFEPRKMKELLEDGRIWWGEGRKNFPRVKAFLSEVQQGVVPSTLWSRTEYGDNQEAAREIKTIFQETYGVFDTPKPTRLIQGMITLATEPQSDDPDIVLDFFAGSGTTANAVLEQNKIDNGNRKFILVQLPEPTGREDFPTIADIAKERVRRVINNLEEKDAPQEGEFVRDDAIKHDHGFRVFKLSDSNFKPWDAGVAHEAGALVQQLDLYIDHIREGRTNQDLLFEILLKRGFPLTTPVEALSLAGHEVFGVAGNGMLICLERDLSLDLIRAMADLTPECVVCLDEGFAGNDQLKTNAVQIFKTKGVAKFLTV
jgi:adenine-specific DNA-methyltransferase